MNMMKVQPIGVVRANDDGFAIVLDAACKAGLMGLDGFSHVQLLWTFSKTTEAERKILCEEESYKHGPDVLGVFATRSPRRPNPIGLSVAQVLWIDHDAATIHVAYLDADDETPVLDIKPYTPSLDRVETPIVPEWCAHWPKSYEASGDYDWSLEMDEK